MQFQLSTKGKHVIHKLDEEAKKHKYHSEESDEGYDEHHDEHHKKHEAKKGGSHKHGEHKSYHDKGEEGNAHMITEYFFSSND